MPRTIPYRHPAEIATLATTLAITGVLVIALSTFTAGGVAIAVVIGFLFNFAMVFFRVSRLKRSALRAEKVPEIKELVERCRERLDVRQRVNVYVVESPTINAYAVGLYSPYTIVLYTGLIRALDTEELTYVIGHEMGHVKLGHTTILALIGQLGMQTFGIPYLGYFIRYIFLFWMRVGEYSADRVGLVACGSLEKALRTQLKLAIGPKRAEQLDVGPIIDKWRNEDVGVVAQLRDVLSTHPGMDARIDKMVDFASSGDAGDV